MFFGKLSSQGEWSYAKATSESFAPHITPR